MDDLTLARSLAAEAASLIRELYGTLEGADYKGEVDPVTAADRAAEAAITSGIARQRPTDGIFAEEGSEAGSRSGRRWVIDPLDGTVNFVHGVPQVGVSIALEDDTGVLLGVTRDVFRNEEFVAQRGGGAALNGNAISVSSCDRLDRALVSTGFGYDRRERPEWYAGHVGVVMSRVEGVRRAGAATLDLAWVACGRLDGHWEFNLSQWDVAVGFLLIEEAGGNVLAIPGFDRHRGFTAGTPTVAQGLHRLIADQV